MKMAGNDYKWFRIAWPFLQGWAWQNTGFENWGMGDWAIFIWV
jgi:hypothetical protein